MVFWSGHEGFRNMGPAADDAVGGAVVGGQYIEYSHFLPIARLLLYFVVLPDPARGSRSDGKVHPCAPEAHREAQPAAYGMCKAPEPRCRPGIA